MMGYLASATLVASLLGAMPEMPQWESDYGRALEATREAGRPLLIVIDAPNEPKERLEPIRLSENKIAGAGFTFAHDVKILQGLFPLFFENFLENRKGVKCFKSVLIGPFEHRPDENSRLISLLHQIAAVNHHNDDAQIVFLGQLRKQVHQMAGYCRAVHRQSFVWIRGLTDGCRVPDAPILDAVPGPPFLKTGDVHKQIQGIGISQEVAQAAQIP